MRQKPHEPWPRLERDLDDSTLVERTRAEIDFLLTQRRYVEAEVLDVLLDNWLAACI
jgi:hypothetical protein